jgi:DNA polymerase
MPQDRPLTDAEAFAALDWLVAAGVDVAVGDDPVDQFAVAAAARLRPAGASVAAMPRPAAPAPAPATAVLNADPTEARDLAATAKTLAELRAVMDAFEGCALKKRATQLCFADGNPEAEIMLVGEGPGEQEDLQGKPFVGRAGQLLDRMLGAIGLDRTKVYIANMVPWRPPGNRDPTPEELALCTPFLHRQVELVAPRILVTLGNVPTKALFETSMGITRVRGQWRDLVIGTHPVKALATLHPAFLLRTPGAKEQAWRDMLALKHAMEADASQ